MMSLPDLLKYQATWNRSRRYLGEDAHSALAYVLILRTGNDLEAHFAPFFERYHLSVGRFSVLMRLQDGPEQTLAPSQLAQALGVTRATITKLLDGLQRSGLIERRLDPTDRRACLVTLTAAARELVEEIVPFHIQQIKQTMSALTKEEQEQLIALLLKLEILS
jgi:MarR family transcriptional repressor of emrRAB